MSVNDLLQWWNVIYLAPLFVSLVWIAAMVVGGSHGGHAHDAGHGVGHTAHGVGQAAHGIEHGMGHLAHDIGHAVEQVIHHGGVHHSHDAGHAGNHGHTAHEHASHGGTHDEDFSGRLLALLGIGQVPITLLIGVFLFCWGAFGMTVNQILAGTMKYPAVYIWPSLGITFAGSFVVTRSMAAIIGRLLPGEETYAVTRFELVGSLGRVVHAISESTGTVDVKDLYGTVHRVQAKSEPGDQAIPSGSEVILVDYDEEDKRFIARISTL